MTPEKGARYYLAATDDACWRWAEQGKVLVWPNGATIAFYSEVADLLTLLGRHGLPPFAAVVLALGLSRPDAVTLLEDKGFSLGEDLKKCVTLFNSIPAEYRRGMSKLKLIEALFEATPIRWLPEDSRRILAGMRQLPSRDLEQVLTNSMKRVDVPQAEWLLRTALESFKLTDWEARFRNGVDSLPSPADVEIPEGQRVRNLLDLLRDDPELCGLSALARDLLAAVSVPRPMTYREELPIGGFSDLSNRGTLDRLVPSELVHDDLTLAVRVALNEALYWRRESPPKTPPVVRCLLIDTGLRMWGLPRLFAVAVSLAFSATVDANASLEAFTTGMDVAEPVTLSTREGLIRALEPLSTTIHPGKALASFVEQIDSADERVEAILITSDDTFDDPSFRAALADVARPMLLATVNREGQYVLWAVARRERRVVSRAKLNLDVLTSRPETLHVSTPDRSLPVIFSLPEFPLRLPHARVDTSRMRYFPGVGVVCVTNDCRLTVWDNAHWAARQLTDRLPSRTPLAMTVREGRVCVLFAPGVNHPVRLVTCELSNGKTSIVSLPHLGQAVRGAWEHEGYFFLEMERNVQVVDPLTGDLLCDQPIPAGFERQNGRFYKSSDDQWWAASFDGRQRRLTRVPLATDTMRPWIIGFVESEEGPIGIACSGAAIHVLRSPVEQHVIGQMLRPPLRIRGVSHDHKRVWIGSNFSPGWILDLAKRSWTIARRDPWDQLEHEGGRYVRESSLRSHLSGLFITADNKLGVVTRRGRRMVFTYYLQRRTIWLGAAEGDVPDSAVHRFQGHDGPSGARYTLQSITGPSGSRAFSDSRGLLHLCPSDPREPELCLLLPGDGAVAAWSSAGQFHGAPYYRGGHVGCDGQELYHLITRFAERWT